MYIILEGIVGSGKSTQSKKLVEYFRAAGRDAILVREPGTTTISEDIRYLCQVKEWDQETMHPLTNAYLYAAARAQTIHTVVQPALHTDKIVVSDRSFLSSCVIQGAAQGLGMETVFSINTSAIGNTLPDKIFYLHIDIDTALARIFDQAGDKFEKEGKDFYQKIVAGYYECKQWDILKNRFFFIDANGTEQETFDQIISFL